MGKCHLLGSMEGPHLEWQGHLSAHPGRALPPPASAGGQLAHSTGFGFNRVMTVFHYTSPCAFLLPPLSSPLCWHPFGMLLHHFGLKPSGKTPKMQRGKLHRAQHSQDEVRLDPKGPSAVSLGTVKPHRRPTADQTPLSWAWGHGRMAPATGQRYYGEATDGEGGDTSHLCFAALRGHAPLPRPRNAIATSPG